MRGQYVQTRDCRRTDHLIDVLGVDDDVVDAMAELASDNAEAAGGVALGVHVHDKPAQAELRKVGRHVDGGRGLPDSALLVNDCVDSWQFAGWDAGRLLPGLYGRVARTHVGRRGLAVHNYLRTKGISPTAMS